MSPAAALIFDFDGVLVESLDIKSDAIAALYGEYGPAISAAALAYHLANLGVSRFEKFRYYETRLLGRVDPDQAVLDALNRRFSALVETAVSCAPMVSGAQALLEAQHGQIPMFVVSATPQDELRRIVNRRGLQRYFEVVHGTPGDKAHHIGDILARHSLPARRTLMVGDSVSDYHSAQDNGVGFLGRVPAGAANPFPATVATVTDLQPLYAHGPAHWLVHSSFAPT